ncbi:MAG: hypothetical protein IJZ81_01035 [Clostridia bacterium]|nr:hypothetical protein [Clostridia bacterium]
MKKSLALLLALVLCVACVAGCGKKTAAPKDATVVTVWSTEAGAQAVYKELVDKWNETTGKEKNIWIDLVVFTDSSRVDIAQQNDSLPNLFDGNAKQREKFIDAGAVAAINDLPGGEEFLKEYGQAGIDGENVFDGKQYTVYSTVRTAGLIINKDLFKQAGIVDKKGKVKAPKTISEMKAAAKKIAAQGDDYYGFAFPLKFGLGYTIDYPTASSFEEAGKENVASYTDLDKLEVHYDGYKDRYQWLLDWRDEDKKTESKNNYGGLFFPNALELDNDTARSYFMGGKIGMFPAISWDVGVYTTQFIIKDFEWDVVEFPVLDGHENTGCYWNQRGGTKLIGKKAALKSDKDAKATMEVLKFWYSKEFRKTVYERGINLSFKNDFLDEVDNSKVTPQFAKFSQWIDENKRYAKSEPYNVEGATWKDLFQKVWNKDMTLDAAIADYEKRATESLRRAIDKGDYDVERQKKVQRYLEGEDGLDLSWTH